MDDRINVCFVDGGGNQVDETLRITFRSPCQHKLDRHCSVPGSETRAMLEYISPPKDLPEANSDYIMEAAPSIFG